jgi:hypothetical protein
MAMTLNMAVRGEGGAQIATYPLQLPAQSHSAFIMNSNIPLSSSTRGVLEINSSCLALPVCLGIPMLALRYAEEAFTSFPALFPAEYPAPFPPNNVVTVPRLVDGSATYQTTVTLINLSDPVYGTPASVTAVFWAENGTPLPLNIQGYSTPQTSIPLPVPLGGSVTFATNGSNLSIGWVELQITSGMVGGQAVLRQTVPGRSDQEAAIPIVTQLSTNQSIPFDNTNNFATSVAVVNPSTNAISVMLMANGEDGTPLFSTPFPIQLPAKSDVAYSIRDQFPALNGIRGVLQFTSNSGFSMIGLRYNPTGPFTSYTPASPN